MTPGFLAWLESLSVATWTRESGSIWAYPTILTLHTAGLSVVVGASAVMDLRLLGFAPGIPLRSLEPLFRLIWSAFAVNAASGILLFLADATVKGTQPVFYVKLAFIGCALWNVSAIRSTFFRSPGSPPVDVVLRGRRLAGWSLFLWSAAITAGRLMAYL